MRKREVGRVKGQKTLKKFLTCKEKMKQQEVVKMSGDEWGQDRCWAEREPERQQLTGMRKEQVSRRKEWLTLLIFQGQICKSRKLSLKFRELRSGVSVEAEVSCRDPGGQQEVRKQRHRLLQPALP